MNKQPSITHRPTEDGEPAALLMKTANEAAAALLSTFRRDTIVRFNNGGGSGGAFLMLDDDPVKTVGISLIQPADGKISFHALINVDFLKDTTRVNKGLGTGGYLYEQVSSLNEAIHLLKELSNLKPL